MGFRLRGDKDVWLCRQGVDLLLAMRQVWNQGQCLEQGNGAAWFSANGEQIQQNAFSGLPGDVKNEGDTLGFRN